MPIGATLLGGCGNYGAAAMPCSHFGWFGKFSRCSPCSDGMSRRFRTQWMALHAAHQSRRVGRCFRVQHVAQDGLHLFTIWLVSYTILQSVVNHRGPRVEQMPRHVAVSQHDSVPIFHAHVFLPFLNPYRGLPSGQARAQQVSAEGY